MRRVITFGTFDLFHIGHLNILRRARELGDWLTVGVSTDDLNVSKKGLAPAYCWAERSAIVSAIRYVDEVFAEESLERKREYIQTARADILVMGDDWAGKFDVLGDIVSVVYLPRTEGISTTSVKQFIASLGASDETRQR